MATLFVPKLYFNGTPRKRGSYYVFMLRVGGHVDIPNLRYYPAEDKVWLPGRKLKNKRQFVSVVRVTADLREAILMLCRKRWGQEVKA